MSYGLKVLRSDGVVRLNMESWSAKFYAHYKVNVRNGTTRTINIPGFNPGTWGVAIHELSGWNSTMQIKLYNGKIVLDPGSNYTSETSTFEFIVYKG